MYGKLLHVYLVILAGRAYLTGLETFMGQFGDNPFKLCTPPRSSPAKMDWWRSTHSAAPLVCATPGPIEHFSSHTFSNTSSGAGIGVVVGDWWQAWWLHPGWKENGRDIGWAEALGFELLVQTLARLGAFPGHVRVYGDNCGVVEGW